MAPRPAKVFVPLAFTCLIVACTTQKPAPEARSRVTPNELFPLREGNAWSYDVDTGEAKTTLAIVRVEAFDGHVAFVRNAESLLQYEVLAEGIRMASTDAWLIHAPLRAGATWSAPRGRTATVSSMDLRVVTAAGTFDACVEVVEVGGELELEVRTVYCPGVGPVSVKSTMRSNTSDRVLTVSAELRGYEVNPRTALPR